MKEDLGFGHFGNRISVWDRNSLKNHDYETVAHIDSYRTVKLYKETLSAEAREKIEDYAKNANPRISTTQHQPVFRTVGGTAIADEQK